MTKIIDIYLMLSMLQIRFLDPLPLPSLKTGDFGDQDCKYRF